MMTENKHRHSHRLANFDYAQPGAYFVTIVTFERVSLFGEIKNGLMVCNTFGDIARWEWESFPKRFPYVQVDEFIIMPNHAHAIIILNINPMAMNRKKLLANGDDLSEVARRENLSPNVNNLRASPRFAAPNPGSLGAIIASYKAQVANKINRLRRTPGHPVWQRIYYDHIIRDDIDWANIRLYIQTNPDNWARDDENRPIPR